MRGARRAADRGRRPRDTVRFPLPGAPYHDVEAQAAGAPKLAARTPLAHYCRKNLGYLAAIQGGADVILETDDDNFPYPAFWDSGAADVSVPTSARHGWLNIYRCFASPDVEVWPRGFPRRELRHSAPPLESLPVRAVCCPVRQALTDDDPDVDTVWWLTRHGPIRFARDRRLALGPGTWPPFNSQNMRWLRPAFPLLYLPGSCSGRLTDIRRSDVAQRVTWERDWHLLVDGPTTRQERNPHDPMHDLLGEMAGYWHGWELGRRPANLSLPGGDLGDAMLRCDGLLVAMRLADREELPRLEAWLAEVA